MSPGRHREPERRDDRQRARRHRRDGCRRARRPPPSRRRRALSPLPPGYTFVALVNIPPYVAGALSIPGTRTLARGQRRAAVPAAAVRARRGSPRRRPGTLPESPPRHRRRHAQHGDRGGMAEVQRGHGRRVEQEAELTHKAPRAAAEAARTSPQQTALRMAVEQVARTRPGRLAGALLMGSAGALPRRDGRPDRRGHRRSRTRGATCPPIRWTR